jgi:hypothetical protein
MKYLCLLSLFAVSAFACYGQKIQGVYVGKILSERNVFVIEADGSHLKGALYVSEKEKFIFSGTYNRPQLKGTLILDSSKNILVKGSLEGYFLTLSFPDTSKMGSRTLHRVSSKIKVDITDLFSNQHDMLLLGAWISFKQTDASGKDITNGTMIREYFLQGRGEGRLTGAPPTVSRNFSSAEVATVMAVRWPIRWETHKGLLDQTEDHAPSGSRINATVHFTMSYSIKNDTLVTTSPNSNLTYWKRK